MLARPGITMDPDIWQRTPSEYDGKRQGNCVTSDHFVITHITAFIERHGYSLLFSWVLAEQGAIPLPSIPLLVAAGALVRLGRLQMPIAIACCVGGALVADTVWFQLGRRRGQRVLRFLCRVALEPDSCVRRTENAFLKYGLNSLLVSKFVPGLNAVASPLAGSSGARYWRFLVYDSAGTVIWSAAYLTLGFIFFEQLESVVGYASRMGSSLLSLVVGLFALWICWKFTQRRRFLKKLKVARITPEELRDRLEAGEDLLIVDLRTKLDGNSSTIPGALRIPAEDLTSGAQAIPRDRDIILFCS
jgi:membrane protein DedA with SNARE-associated domain